MQNKAIHNIGPLVISSSKTPAPALSDLHWAYLSFDENTDSWYLKTVPVSSEILSWESPVTKPAPNKINIVACSDSENELTWSPTCAVLKHQKWMQYSTTQEPSELNGWGYHIFGKTVHVLEAVDVGVIASDLHVPNLTEDQKEALSQQYKIWRKNKLLLLRADFRSAWEFYSEDKNPAVQRLMAVAKLSLLLSKQHENDFIFFAQVFFEGMRAGFDFHLKDASAIMLNELSIEDFRTTMHDLVTQAWSSESLEFFASLIENLEYDKAQYLLQLPTVQAQIVRLLLSDDFRIELFSGCHDDEIATILAISEVNAQLQSIVHSAKSLDSLIWDAEDKKDAIVKAIGIPTAQTWMTDINSLKIMKKNTSRQLFSRLIWDNLALFAKTVVNPHEFCDALWTLCTNDECSDTELQQKINAFVTATPMKDYECLFGAVSYRDVLSDDTMTTERKITFFKIPYISESMIGSGFLALMNAAEISGENKEAFYQAFTPVQIKSFIIGTDGAAFRCLSSDQKLRARRAFSTEELNTLDFFKTNSNTTESGGLQPSLFMRIMTHRATPYLSAILLLAGVALMATTAYLGLGAGLAAVGGLMLFGSFMYRGERGRNLNPESSTEQRARMV